MTQTVKMNELFSPTASTSQVIYPAIIVLKCDLNAIFILPKSKHFILFFTYFAEDLFTLNSNKCRKVCKVDGSPQLHTRDGSMYLNILKPKILPFSVPVRLPGSTLTLLLAGVQRVQVEWGLGNPRESSAM